jgi:hypothetical protein
MELTPNESRILAKATPLKEAFSPETQASLEAISHVAEEFDDLIKAMTHDLPSARIHSSWLPDLDEGFPQPLAAASTKPMVKVWDRIIGKEVEVSIDMAEAMEYVDSVRPPRSRTVKGDPSGALLKSRSEYEMPFYSSFFTMAMPVPPRKHVLLENFSFDVGFSVAVSAAAYPTCYGATAEDRLCASLVKTGGTVGVLTPKE